MIASFRHRLVFLHLPKNAGKAVSQSIQEAFAGDRTLVSGWGIENGVDLAHPLAAHIKALFPAVREMMAKEETRTIAIVRDPLTRCLAAFREHRNQFADHPVACETLEGYLDGIEAERYREEGSDGYLYIHGAPQHEFLWDQGRLLAGKVLQLEDPLFHPKLCLAMGEPLPPLPPRALPTGPTLYLKSTEVRRILKLYEQDYEFIDSLE